jgi:hypothetical protein
MVAVPPDEESEGAPFTCRTFGMSPCREGELPAEGGRISLVLFFFDWWEFNSISSTSKVASCLAAPDEASEASPLTCRIFDWSPCSDGEL